MKKSIILGLLVITGGISAHAATPSPQMVDLLKTDPDRALALMAPSRMAGEDRSTISAFTGPGGQDYRNGHFARHLQDLKSSRAAVDKDAAVAFATLPPPSAPSIASVRVPVLLIDFPDEITPHTAADLDARLFGSAYSPNMTEYYDEVSYGQLEITGDVYGPFTMEKSYSEYGWGSDEAREFIADAILAADPTVDFSQYDSDGDGYVDAVVVAASEYISAWGWEIAHKWSLITPLTVDGVIASDYTSQDDDQPAGIYCHEFGHILGLVDFYDEEKIHEWCLMGTGCHLDPPAHLSAWHKVYLGWVEPTEIIGSVSGQTIRNVEENQEIFKLRPANLPLEQYFLIENRQLIGSDAALPGEGLLIWHIGGTRGSGAVLALEVAGEGAGDSSASAVPFPGSTGNTDFNADSVPSSDFIETILDPDSYIRIENISSSASTMTADLIVPGSLYGWRGLESGSTQTLNDVFFADSSMGWAVGNNGTILCTTNAGATWAAQTSPVSSDLLGVTFTDVANGWICGEGGRLLHTSDGLTWRRQMSGTSDTLVDLSFANRYRGWCIGTNGTVLKTANGGRSWTDISPDFMGDIPSRVQFVSTTCGFIACKDEPLLYTDDGGSTWSYSSLAWPGALGFYAWADNFLCYVNSLYFTVNFEGYEASARVRDSSSYRMEDVDFSGTQGMSIGAGVSVYYDLDEDFFWPETDSSGDMDALNNQTWADPHDLFSILTSSMAAVDVVDSSNPFLSNPAYAVGSQGTILKHLQITALITNLRGFAESFLVPDDSLLDGVIQRPPLDDLFLEVDPAQYYEYELLNRDIPNLPIPIP